MSAKVGAEVGSRQKELWGIFMELPERTEAGKRQGIQADRGRLADPEHTGPYSHATETERQMQGLRS